MVVEAGSFRETQKDIRQVITNEHILSGITSWNNVILAKRGLSGYERYSELCAERNNLSYYML